ncbi:MAG: hypothetical protein KGZ81_13395 [Flavobacteriales bacterium]|nr:hypothetical protein [Flavobacteriales bacterium]
MKTKYLRALSLINISIVVYFATIYTLYVAKIDFVLVGVFRELLTIPFLLAQIVFLVIGVIYYFRYKANFLFILSWLALAICSYFTLSTF